MRLHHVQLAIPQGSEEVARQFWIRLLGFEEIAKPPELAQRGGFWCVLGAVEVHIGIEEDFSPARKAHPAFLVPDLGDVAAQLEQAGHEVRPDGLFPGHRRFYVDDPFGNRLEFLEVEN